MINKETITTKTCLGETIEIPTSYLKGRSEDDFFVLCVDDDSMYPQYMKNDKVIILKQSDIDCGGQVAAVTYDGENITLKKIVYKQDKSMIKLIPINPNHQTKCIDDEALEHFQVLGIPKYLVRDIEDGEQL